MALHLFKHDTNTKCHAGATHPSVSSPWLLYRSENFTPKGNYATVSCKHETTTRFVWNRSSGGLERVAHAWHLRSWMARVFYQHGVYLQITEIWGDPSSCKRDTKSTIHPGMKLARKCEFSHVNTPQKPIGLISKSLFCTFLGRFWTTTTWKSWISYFMKNVNKQWRNYFLFLNLDMVPWNSTSLRRDSPTSDKVSG